MTDARAGPEFWWAGLVAGLQVGQAIRCTLQLLGFGVGSSSLPVAMQPTLIYDLGVKYVWNHLEHLSQ